MVSSKPIACGGVRDSEAEETKPEGKHEDIHLKGAPGMKRKPKQTSHTDRDAGSRMRFREGKEAADVRIP
jgi:hypothetical protein